MVDFPGLNAGSLLPYSSVVDRNDRLTRMADSILRTNLTLFIRRGHRFTDQPRLYPQLENSVIAQPTPSARLYRAIKALWLNIFKTPIVIHSSVINHEQPESLFLFLCGISVCNTTVLFLRLCFGAHH